MKKLCLVMLSLCLACMAADSVLIAAGRGTPVIDGSLDDDAWKDSIACGPFLLNLTNSFATQQTAVSFLWDDECLYAAFNCLENALNPAENRVHEFKNGYAETDSDNVYTSDMVELLLGNGGNGMLYDIIVSASGVVCDCTSKLDAAEYWSNRDRGWQSNAKVAVGIESERKEARWCVEMALPWSGMGGAPKVGDSWSVLASRRECASKEASALQTVVNGGIHSRANLGRMVFMEKVPGIQITAFPEFIPGENALEVVKTNGLPVHLNGNAYFGKDVITAKSYVGKEKGRMPFNIDKSGDFVFKWYLSQGSTVYYQSPAYKCHVSMRVLEARLEKAELSVNGTSVRGLLPLKTGMNEFALKASEGAVVSLKVGGTEIPYPDGWAKGDDGVERLSVMCEKSVVWPNWHVNGIYLNRGGLQQILFYPQGIKGRTVSDYTMTFELPKGVKLVGASGYYGLFPLETKTLGTVVREGVEFTRHAITVKKALPYVEQRQSHELIAVVVGIDEAIAVDETRIYYYAGSREGNALELPNSFAAHIIEAAKGVQPKDVFIELWVSWHNVMDAKVLRRKLFYYMADSGVNEVTGGADVKDRLKGITNFNFDSWNFNCSDYIKAHPERAQVEYSGRVSKLFVCSTSMVEDADFAVFLKGRLKPWHERWGCNGHIDWDYESHVKNSYLSCYCRRCIGKFAEFAGIAPEGLTADSINKNHLEKWQAFCNRRVAAFASLLCRTIHEELPGTVLSIYSGYQSDSTKLIYGIDWSLMEGVVDIAMCGYGRSPKDLRDTQACFSNTKLVLGEVIYPYNRTLRDAPQAAHAATLMRRCCDATMGCLIYEYPTLDGRSFLAISQLSRLLSKYEPFFKTGLRSPRKVTAQNIDDAEYEVLENGKGDFIVVLMNFKDKPREYSFEVELPVGKQLFDDDGNQLGGKVAATVDAFGTKVLSTK